MYGNAAGKVDRTGLLVRVYINDGLECKTGWRQGATTNSKGTSSPQQELTADDLFLGELLGERGQSLGEGVDAPIFANESSSTSLDWAEMGRLSLSVK